MNIQVCKDTSDAVAFYLPQRLYLKPFAKLNISIQLPNHKVHGKSISNWELMENLRKIIQPDHFSLLKVSKHCSEVIRFDAELEKRDRLQTVLSRLEDRVIKLNDYPDPLKVRVSEAKSEFPSRHSWDSFFRDATDMDEMKPGERPDTVHIAYMPIAWFIHAHDKDSDPLPSVSIFKKAFEKFGSIRQVDVPITDPYRMQMKAAIRGITIPASECKLYFEGYVQFSEYVGFVRCMDALRGKKLLRKKEDIAEWCCITVDFDKSKHMTDAAVKRRAIVRERLSARQRAKDEEERQEKEVLAKREARERQKMERIETEKLLKMKDREEKRKKKQLAKLMQRDDVNLNERVAEEQTKLIRVQKRLQAIRIIEELFKRIELRPELQHRVDKHQRYYQAGEHMARARIVDKFKRQQEQAVDEQREMLQKSMNGSIVIRTALEMKKPRRESSVSSLSSCEDRQKRIKVEKLTTPEREMEYNRTGVGVYGAYGFGYPFPACPPPYTFPPNMASMYYPVRGAYYPPPDMYARRGGGGGRMRGRGRGGGRGRGLRMPYFEGPDAAHQYYQYFKKLAESENRSEHDDRTRSRSRRRSYSRSRSRSRRRSYTHSRSRSRSRGRRSRSRRSRSRSRRSRSRSRRSRSRSHHARSRSRRSRSRTYKSRSRSKKRTPTPQNKSKVVETPLDKPRERSKSWSLPKDAGDKAWSKSPKEKS